MTPQWTYIAIANLKRKVKEAEAENARLRDAVEFLLKEKINATELLMPSLTHRIKEVK